MSLPEFKSFERIPRLRNNGIIITEKIDGTNAIIHIDDTGTVLTAGSRSRWITPEHDNYGFALWAQENETELLILGPGYHYGEWWGAGIQRRYGQDRKRFSLFNVARWGALGLPACCEVVPVLYAGSYAPEAIEDAKQGLRLNGSVAASGFMDPEGIVVYQTGSRSLSKWTFGGDGHKGEGRK